MKTLEWEATWTVWATGLYQELNNYSFSECFSDRRKAQDKYEELVKSERYRQVLIEETKCIEYWIYEDENIE